MDITARLRGKTVAAVMTNGHVLQIRTTDGAEISIAWLDGEGRPIKGKPSASSGGVRLLARGVRDLLYFPEIRTKGSA